MIADPKEAAGDRHKICLIWGFVGALANSFATLGFYFAGLQETVHGLDLSGKVGFPLSLAILIAVMVLGVRAAQATVAAGEDFGYGATLWAAFRIAFYSALFFTILYLLYFVFINAGLRDVMLEQQMKQMADRGASDATLEKASSFLRLMVSPGAVFAVGLVSWTLIGLVLSLLLAVFLKRPGRPVAPPPLA
jgi:hypothetical protein